MHGKSTGYRGEPLDAGRGYHPPVGPTSNMGQGPGANRTIHGTGSQAQHGDVVGPAPVRGRPLEG